MLLKYLQKIFMEQTKKKKKKKTKKEKKFVYIHFTQSLRPGIGIDMGIIHERANVERHNVITIIY